MTIREEMVRRRLDNFWGYGSFDAPVWFVGMEEGLSGNDEAEIAIRFRATDGKILADIRRDMSALSGHMRWFRPPYPVQTTWKYPIALYLYLSNGRPPSKQEISLYQGLRFADAARALTNAIELMPLPSNKAHESTWLYRNYSSLGLASRDQYLEQYKPLRIRRLRDLVGRYQPRLIVFHSVGYLHDWRAVIGTPLKELTRQMYFAQHDLTSFCVIPQGASFGMSYQRLYEYAELIKPAIQLARKPPE